MNALRTFASFLCAAVVIIPLAGLSATESRSCAASLKRFAHANTGTETVRAFSRDCSEKKTTAALVIRYGQSVQEYACKEPGDTLRSVRIDTGSAVYVYYAGGSR